MAQLIQLGGQTIKNPTSLDLEDYNITKAGRTADATMQIDFIAAKRKFLLKYDVLSGAEYAIIKSIIRTSTMFFNISYMDNDEQMTAEVYVGAIKRTTFRNDTGAIYFKDVTFDLIER
jgi:hypothetical protein